MLFIMYIEIVKKKHALLTIGKLNMKKDLTEKLQSLKRYNDNII